MDFGWYVPCNVKLCSVIWCNVNVLSLYSAAAAADAGQPASKKAVPGNKTLWLWNTSKFQNHAKKLPNRSSEILEKIL